MSAPITLDAVRAAPKVLLHDHLDGGLRPLTAIELARDQGYTELPTTDPAELADWFHRGAQQGSHPVSLASYENATNHQDQFKDSYLRHS